MHSNTIFLEMTKLYSVKCIYIFPYYFTNILNASLPFDAS